MDLSIDRFDYTKSLEQQRILFKDCFPETNGESIQGTDHYLWKFHSFPNPVTSWEYVAYLGHEMVGYYAAIPYRYKIGNKETAVGMVCDVMTSSKFRGKGIFTKMGFYSTGELAKEIPFSIGYPIRKEVIPGHLKVGWEAPFSLPLYIKFFRLNALLSTKKIGFLGPLANAVLSIFNGIVKTRSNSKYSFSLVEDINLVKDYDSFAKEWSCSVKNALIKDLPFAAWRYSAPQRHYKFLSIHGSNGKMIGFVSFRNIVKEGVPSYGILDHMVLPGYEDCSGLINQVLSDCAKKENIEALMTMMSRTAAAKCQLLKNGFLKSPFVFQLIIKNLTKEFSDEELFDERSWQLMWVDSDDL